MQKSFVVEVYVMNGERTYIVRVANEQTKGFDPVLVTSEVDKVSDYLKSV